MYSVLLFKAHPSVHTGWPSITQGVAGEQWKEIQTWRMTQTKEGVVGRGCEHDGVGETDVTNSTLLQAPLFCPFNNLQKECEDHVQALSQQSTPRTVYSHRDQWDPIPGELSLGNTVSIDTPLWTRYPLLASKLIVSWALQNPVLRGPPEEIISFQASWA